MAQLSWNMSMFVVMVALICSFETKKSEAVPAVCKNCKMYNLRLHENSPLILVPTKGSKLVGDTPSQNIFYSLLRRILTGKHTELYSNATEGPDGAETNSTESPFPDVINIPVLVEQPELPAPSPSPTVPVLIQSIVGNSSVVNDKTSSGGLSIQISTSINIGDNFNQGSQGSIVGPLVLSTSIQLTPNNDVQPKMNSCADCYNNNYNDDEDYYHDQYESSGDEENNISMTTDSSDDSSNSTTVRDSYIEI